MRDIGIGREIQGQVPLNEKRTLLQDQNITVRYVLRGSLHTTQLSPADWSTNLADLGGIEMGILRFARSI